MSEPTKVPTPGLNGQYVPAAEYWDPDNPEQPGDAWEGGGVPWRSAGPDLMATLPAAEPPELWHPPRADLEGRESAPTGPRWPAPVYISELAGTNSVVDFLWHGCIARGHLTMLSALMKCGKSTLLGFLLRALQTGSPFLGRATKKCRTLIVSEESAALWVRRREALGLTDELSVLSRPMLAKPSFADWSDFVGFVGKQAAARSVNLIVFDTISAVAPWRNENDAAEVQGTMTPLNHLTQAGLGVLLFHHIGKTDGSEGRAARGSTALAGAVDVLLEMWRHKADDRQDRRRVLSGLGRFDEVLEEVVIELAEDGSGYTAEGDRKEVAARELAARLPDYLPGEPPGSTIAEVHQAMPKGDRPARGVVGAALAASAAAGLWMSSGTGKKNDARRFWRA